MTAPLTAEQEKALRETHAETLARMGRCADGIVCRICALLATLDEDRRLLVRARARAEKAEALLKEVVAAMRFQIVSFMPPETLKRIDAALSGEERET